LILYTITLNRTVIRYFIITSIIVYNFIAYLIDHSNMKKFMHNAGETGFLVCSVYTFAYINVNIMRVFLISLPIIVYT
jgi:hypothetical protein